MAEKQPPNTGLPPRFIVDQNAGKLTKWLRMLGYDALMFRGSDDGAMVSVALAEGRTILTRDRQVMQRRIVASGAVRAILLTCDDPVDQLRYVVHKAGLDWAHAPLTICLADDTPLEPITRERVRAALPAYVYRTQEGFMQCPRCGRIYWRGSHWLAMQDQMRRFSSPTITQGDQSA